MFQPAISDIPGKVRPFEFIYYPALKYSIIGKHAPKFLCSQNPLAWPTNCIPCHTAPKETKTQYCT